MSMLLALRDTVWPATGSKASVTSYRQPAAESGITSEEPTPRPPKKRTIEIGLIGIYVGDVGKAAAEVETKKWNAAYHKQAAEKAQQELVEAEAAHAIALKRAHEIIATYADENDL